MTSSYEARRLKNLEDNKRVLRELGLLNPFAPLPKVVHHAAPRPKKRKRESAGTPTAAKAFKVDESQGSVFTPGERRRSSRLRGDTPATPGDIDEEVKRERAEEEEEGYRRPKIPPNRPNFYGPVPDVESGTWWETRMECSAAGIHRPWVAGIHGGEEGCYSLALSGGYEDDIDMGECFTYTGEGGRDLKGTKANPKNLRTAAQTRDQTLTRGNLALSASVETGNPVRVIRGYKLRGPFAPEEGYRYDGLYKVEKYWFTVGLSGYGVFKFALKRLTDQAPPPWDLTGPNSCQDSGVGSEIGSATPMDGLSDAGSDDKGSEMSDHEDKENVAPKIEDATTEEDGCIKQEPAVDNITEEADSKPAAVKEEPTSPFKECGASNKDEDQEANNIKLEIKDEANSQDSGIGSEPNSQCSTGAGSEATDDHSELPAKTTSEAPLAKDPSQKPSAKDPSQKPSSKDPSQKPSAKDPSQKPSAKDPSQKPSAKDPSQKPSAKDPSQKPSAKVPSQKPSAKDPSQKPSAKDSSQKPSTKDPSQKPSAKDSSQKPSAKDPSQKPSAKDPSQQPSAKDPSQKPSAKDPSQKAEVKTKTKKSTKPAEKAVEKAAKKATSPTSFFPIFQKQKK